MPLLSKMADAELLERSLGGDPEAFATFYRRHMPLVLAVLVRRTGNGELAADLAAETFAAALESRHTFDPKRGSARAWLCGIAFNKFYNSLRRGRVEEGARRRLGMRAIPFYDSDSERVDDIVSAAAELGDLEDVLGELSVEARVAIESRVLEEDGYDEIARRMECSEAVVRKRVSRGLRLLRDRLEELR